MKTIGLLVGIAGALLAGAGCGGTVVFDEDGGEGGQGAGSSQQGPITSATSAQGGGDVVSTTVVGTTAPATVGPGPGPSTSTGTAGCGSFLDGFGFDADCEDCMNASCCVELLACDVGTECYDCVFGSGECPSGATAALDALFNGCYPTCQPLCEGPQCGPEDFQCNDGSCIPFSWVCDGRGDCSGFEDEQFCEQNGICGSGVSTFDPGADQCLGDFCCDQFQQCSSFGQDPEACNQCLQNQGGPLCDDAIQCAFDSGCFGGGDFFPICGDLGVQDPQLAECLNENCCAEFDACSSGPDGPQGCADCFVDGGGPLCDDAMECFFSVCGGDQQGGGGDRPPP